MNKRIKWEIEQLKKLKDPKWVKKEMVNQQKYLFDSKHVDITFRYIYSIFSIFLSFIFIFFIFKAFETYEWYYFGLMALFGFFAVKSTYALIKYWTIYRKLN